MTVALDPRTHRCRRCDEPTYRDPRAQFCWSCQKAVEREREARRARNRSKLRQVVAA